MWSPTYFICTTLKHVLPGSCFIWLWTKLCQYIYDHYSHSVQCAMSLHFYLFLSLKILILTSYNDLHQVWLIMACFFPLEVISGVYFILFQQGTIHLGVFFWGVSIEYTHFYLRLTFGSLHLGSLQSSHEEPRRLPLLVAFK